MENDFTAFINKAYLEWQHKKGVPCTYREWSSYLELDHTLVSHYHNGRRKPSSEATITKLANKLGPCVYETLGLIRPDPLLRFVIDSWDWLGESEKERVLLIVEELSGIQRGDEQKRYLLSIIDGA